MGSGKLRQIGTAGPGSTPGPMLAIHGKLYSGIGSDGFPSRQCAKEEAMAEREHDGLIIKREEVVKAAAPWVQPALLGALCLYINEEGSQWHYTDASTSLHVSWLGLSCVPLEGSQIKSDVVAIKTNKRTLLNLQNT